MIDICRLRGLFFLSSMFSNVIAMRERSFLLTILFLPFRRLLSPLTGEYAFVQNEGYRVSIDGARARSASVTIVTICLE